MIKYDNTAEAAASAYQDSILRISNDKSLSSFEREVQSAEAKREYLTFIREYIEELKAGTTVGARVYCNRYAKHFGMRYYRAEGEIEVISEDNQWAGYLKAAPPLGSLVVREIHPKLGKTHHSKLYDRDGRNVWKFAGREITC